MPENDAVTKGDLKNALNEMMGQMMGQLIGVIKETVAASEARIMAEMNRRFAESQREFNAFRAAFVALQNKVDALSAEFVALQDEFVSFQDDVTERLRRVEKQIQALRDRVDNHFYELDIKIINRSDRAMEYADKTGEKLNRAWITKLDGQAGVIDDFRTEQIVMGKVQDEIRGDIEKTKNAHGVEIKDLKHRVAVLEEEVFPASSGKD